MLPPQTHSALGVSISSQTQGSAFSCITLAWASLLKGAVLSCCRFFWVGEESFLVSESRLCLTFVPLGLRPFLSLVGALVTLPASWVWLGLLLLPPWVSLKNISQKWDFGPASTCWGSFVWHIGAIGCFCWGFAAGPLGLLQCHTVLAFFLICCRLASGGLALSFGVCPASASSVLFQADW